MKTETVGYIVLGEGKPMEWIHDRWNRGLYFGRSATLFKDYATARRRIVQDKKSMALMGITPSINYRVLRIQTWSK